MPFSNSKQLMICLLILTAALYSCMDSGANANHATETVLSQEPDEKIDTVFNTYSNFIHMVGINLPDHWTLDHGLSEHSIVRGFELDTGITFSLNVIPVDEKFPDAKGDNPIDIWSYYLESKEAWNRQMTTSLAQAVNTEIKSLKTEKSFLKNRVCVKSYQTFDFRDTDLEYENTMIRYQTATEGRMYTFSLTVPTLFYNLTPQYYEDIFLHIHFLRNRKESPF
jgi:hypothetical protein